MLRVQVYSGGSWQTIAMARKDSVTGSQRTVDATTKDDAWWTRDLAAHRSITMECESLAGDPAAYRAAISAINADGINARIVDGGEIVASMHASVKLDISGPFDGAAVAMLTLKATGAATSDAAPLGQVATPTISPPGGAITTETLISLACSTQAAAIRYSTDGSDPTAASTLYTAAFTLSAGSPTIKARAFLAGLADSDVASAGFTVSPASLVDPAKWIGAWDFAGGSPASIVSGGQGLGSIFPGYSTALSPAQNNRLESYATAESARITDSALSLSTFSFAATVYQPKSIHLFYLGLHTESAGAVLRLIGDGRLEGDSIVNGAFAADYASPYHLALTYDGSTARIYKDGAQVWSGAISKGSGAQRAGVYFGYNSGAPIRYIDNLALTREVLSPSAIAALAAGHMPDAAGVLV